jgi:hypothetical protein
MGTAETPASAARLWVFDRGALHEGDVILELGEGFKSWVISKFDGSPFSHALIWAGNTDFVESVGSGVRNLSFARVVIAEPDRWKLLRQSDREIGKRAALAARRLVAKHYNILGALTSLAPGPGSANFTQAFCTELVAYAYHEAGCDLVPGCPPHKVTPRMLLESPVLSPHKLPILECDPKGAEWARKLLDRDAAYETSLMADEVRVARAAFAEVQPFLGCLPPIAIPGLANPPGNLHELIDLLAHLPLEHARVVLDHLVTALRAVGYFNLLDAPMKDVRETFIKSGMQIRWGNMPCSELDALRKDMLEQCRGYGETAKRYLDNALICEKLSKSAGHTLWEELASMHRRNYQQFLALRAMGIDMSSDAWAAGGRE